MSLLCIDCVTTLICLCHGELDLMHARCMWNILLFFQRIIVKSSKCVFCTFFDISFGDVLSCAGSPEEVYYFLSLDPEQSVSFFSLHFLWLWKRMTFNCISLCIVYHAYFQSMT